MQLKIYLIIEMIDLAIDGRCFLYNEFDEAIQELDLLFNTENTELIGYPTFGSNFEQFLWMMNPATNELEKYIYELIGNTTYLQRYVQNVEISTVKGEYRLIYKVKIYLKKDKDTNLVKEYELR